MSKLGPITIARFWSKVSVGRDTECWEWKGSTRRGYGKLKVRGKTISAHRLAFELATGEDLGDRLACHHCDNRLCCNPSHIYAGDYSTNGLDAVARGLKIPTDQRGARNGNAKLTASQVAEIKGRIARGETNTAIAEDFPVGHALISKIRTGVYWR